MNEYPGNGNPYNNPYGASYGNPYGTPQRVTDKKAFLQLPENKKFRSEIKGAAILGYVCAGVTLLLSVIVGGNLFGLIDIAILVGLSLGIQMTANKLWAILMTVYGGINLIITIALTGSLGGWLPLVAGIIALVYISKLDKAWDAYNMPQQPYNPYGGNYPPPPPPAGM